MTKYVVDASVIITALSQKNHTATKLLSKLLRLSKKDQASLHAPSFLDLEVANGIRFSNTDTKLAQEQLTRYFDLPITHPKLSEDVTRLSLHHSYQNQTTIYDTAYHILAISLDATFITCDRKYFQKAKHLKHIKLLT